MKRIFAITLMFAVCTLLSQCRKPEIPVNEDVKPQSITFSTGGNGEKGHLFFEEDKLKYQWETDDKIYVYSSTEESQPNFSTGHYCGELSLKSGSGTASGTFYVESMDIPTNTKYLRFIHFRSDGGVVVSTTSDGVSAICDLSQQNGLLTGDGSVSTKLIAYCDEPYNPNGVYQNCKLKTPFAILNLDLSLFSNKVYMSCILENGVNVAASGQITGVSGIYTDLNGLKTDVSNTTDDAEYYIAVMPIGSGNPIKFADHPLNYTPSGSTRIKAASLAIPSGGILAGKYYHNSSSKDTDENDDSSIKFRGISELPAEALPGVFTVGSRQSVHFAKGNYYYNNSKGNGGFEQYQYKYRSNWAADHITTFYWTVKDYYGAVASVSTTSSTGGIVNWGVNISGDWETLSKNQWVYLFNSRSTTYKKISYTASDDVMGILIPPDNNPITNFSTITNYTSLMDNNMVFLPAAGYRNGSTNILCTNGASSDSDKKAYYWSSTQYVNGSVTPYPDAWAVKYEKNDASVVIGHYSKTTYAFAVRLVCN